MTHITDWYATFCHLAGVDPADNQPGTFPIDSVDLWPLVTGTTTREPRDTIIIGHNFSYGATNSIGALIHGDWKLIVGEQGYSDYRGPLFPCIPATPSQCCCSVVVLKS